MVDLRNITSLFDLINVSYGLSGKSIELVGKRNMDYIETIHEIKRTKDGLNILNAYCKANPEDINAHKILEEVAKFEGNYGDGTSFLTMFLTYLMNHNTKSMCKNSINKDIDLILTAIDKQIIKEEKNDTHLERWINTICKQDPISQPIIDFLKENPRSNTSSLKYIDNPDEPSEIIFLPKRGYFVSCYANRRFIGGAYNGFKDVYLTLLDGNLTEDTLKEIENRSIIERRRHLILCRDYSNEINVLINELSTKNLMVLRYAATEEDENNIKADIRKMFKLENSEEGGKSTGEVSEIIVDGDGVFFLGSPLSREALEDYVGDIRNGFIGDSIERGALEYRCRNILSNNTFDILINSTTKTRQNVIKDMIEDVFRSLPHYNKGMITGGMSYISSRSKSQGAIMTIAKTIKQKLRNGETEVSKIKPIDLLENVKAAYKIIRNFAIALLDTHGTPVIIKRHGR